MWFKSECNQISERLWEYSAQRLSTAETAQVESHLQQCVRCQAEAEAYRQTAGMLGAVRRLPVPASQTTWRDLRPSLSPSRRPALRSANLLPRLTLGGAGTALAATLLAVFLSSGHKTPQGGSPTLPSSRQQQVRSADSSVSSPAAVETVQDSTNSGAVDRMPSGPTFSPFFSGASSFLQTSDSAETQKTVQPPALPRVRRRSHSRFARSGTAGKQPQSVPASEEAVAELDGGNVLPRTQKNYVLNPVSSSAEDETAHHYVISSIPVSPNGSGTAAASEGTEEGRAW